MEKKTLEKLAAQFDDLSAIMLAISGTFRASGGGAGEDADDEPAAPPVRRSRAATKPKPATRGKAKAAEDDETELDVDTVREKLKDLAAAKGAAKMAEALAEYGAGRLPEVEEADWPALLKTIETMMEEEDEAPAPKARTRKAKSKAAAPTYEEVEAAFRALLKADKAKAKGVLEELGVARLSEIDAEDEGTLVDTMAAIKAAEEEDDEDDMV